MVSFIEFLIENMNKKNFYRTTHPNFRNERYNLFAY